jgi:uncharacterized damage-inducible protein DinB
MNLSDIHFLYEFNFWAKDRILGIVETLTPEQFTHDFHSSHGGVQGTLVHTMGAEEIWLMRWKGDSPASGRKPEDFPTVESLSNRWEMAAMEILGFCHTLKKDRDLERMLSYYDFAGNSRSEPLGIAMQHLVNHSTYHRGQVVTMLRQLGVKPVATDLITYYRERQKGM